MQEGAGGGGEVGGIHLLLAILADGEEQARQLGEMADDPRSGSERYRGAARVLQSTLGRAVSVARAIEAAAPGSSRGTDRSDSPRSADESSGGTAAVEVQERQGVCKRRKGLPRWTAKFRVPDANMEATPDDGFSWRKYGQKDILGAKFPRGYYRCTYRTAQSCQATKQVQRSDSDFCVFDVTYQGEHTCHQKARHAAAAAAAAANPAAAPAHGVGQSPPSPSPQHQDPSMELLLGFKDVLKVETTTPAAKATLHGDHGATPFSFPSISMPFHAAAAAADSSSDPGGPSCYFPLPPHCQPAVVGSYDVYDYDQPAGAPRAAESELGEVVSRATSAAAAAGFDFSSLYHHAELDPHLPFPPFGGPSHGPFQ